jgi:hypothetical protein
MDLYNPSAKHYTIKTFVGISVKKKASSHSEEPQYEHSGTHSRLLPELFGMPPCDIMIGG